MATKSKKLSIINKAKEETKQSKVYKDLCKEYKVKENTLDIVPITFKDLDVSATTNHGVIYLNSQLIDSNIKKISSYIIHEFTHFLQQTMNDEPTKGSDSDDYLYDNDEVEGFKNQIDYVEDEFGLNEADKYVNQVLDHHDKSGKERKKLKDKLLD